MRKVTLHVVCACLAISAFLTAPFQAQGQTLDWGQKIESSNDDVQEDFAIDPDGNQYVVGFYDSAVSVGDLKTVSTQSNIDKGLYIAKINDNGKDVWLENSVSKNFTQDDLDRNTQIAYANGSIFISGVTDKKVAFLGGSVSPTQQEEAIQYVAKFDTSGSFQAIQKVAQSYLTGTSATIKLRDLIADQNGDLYFSGDFNASNSMDSFQIGTALYNQSDFNQPTGNATTGGFVFQYDQSFNFQWSRLFLTQTGKALSFDELAYDKANNQVNLSGQLREDLIHQGQTLSYSAMHPGTFLLEMDGSGNLQWWEVLNNVFFNPFTTDDLEVDPAGRIYIGGSNFGDQQGYLAKLSTTGDLTWADTIGSANQNPIKSIAVDNGNLYAAGRFDPDTLSFQSQGNLIGQYDTSGLSQWFATYGDPLGSNDGALVIDLEAQANKIYAFGSYSFNAENGLLHTVNDELIRAGRSMVSLGETDGYVLKFDGDLVPCYGINLNADFTQDEACKGDSVTLTSQITTSAYGKIQYEWQLNNDTVYGEEIAYPLPDVLNDVSLTVETTSGCIDSVDKEVDMLPTPISNFETEKQGNGKVEFTPFSTGYGYFLWEFGDGDTASDAVVTHQYNENKTYDVTLTTQPTDSAQCNSTTTKTINITSAPDDPGGITNQEPVNQFQLYPRPFNENLNIGYVLASSVHVKIQLVNSHGKILRTLQDTRQPAGHYRTNLSGADQLSEGLYHLVIEVDGEPYAYQVPKVD